MTAATTVAKTSGQPGPKPDFLVVEDSLKCQTENGEISLSLVVPFDVYERMIEFEGEEGKHLPSYLLKEVVPETEAKKLRGLADGAKAFKILMRYSEEIGNRLGASLGELAGSSD